MHPDARHSVRHVLSALYRATSMTAALATPWTSTMPSSPIEFGEFDRADIVGKAERGACITSQ